MGGVVFEQLEYFKVFLGTALLYLAVALRERRGMLLLNEFSLRIVVVARLADDSGMGVGLAVAEHQCPVGGVEQHFAEHNVPVGTPVATDEIGRAGGDGRSFGVLVSAFVEINHHFINLGDFGFLA